MFLSLFLSFFLSFFLRYGAPNTDDGSHDIHMTTIFYLKAGTNKPIQIEYRYEERR